MRKTVYSCDVCGSEFEDENDLGTMRYSNARDRVEKHADICGDCAEKLPGESAKMRGRKPQAAEVA